MPDSVIFARPDVTIAAAVPATVPHARLVNYTNAVQVAVEATDRGRVNVTVGLGINTNVTLGTQTTVAGAGNTTLLQSGAGVTAGAGGDITVSPGGAVGGVLANAGNIIFAAAAGVAGGTQTQVIVQSSGLSGVALRPDASATVASGGATTAWSTTFTAAVRPENNAALTLSTVQVAAGAGPLLSLTASNAVTAGAGGGITLTGGVGTGAGGTGGAITLTAGAGGTTGAAGAGGAVNATTGAAGAGSGSNGGDVVITLGAGDGAGTRGTIQIVAATTSNVRPTTTNVVSLGTTALAYAAVYPRIVRADTGFTMTIQRDDGSAAITVRTGSTTLIGPVALTFSDDVDARFGGSDDARFRWSTSSANNAMVIATNVNSAAQSGNVIVTTVANVANEHGLAAVATPRLAIFSAADMSVAGNRTQYIQMYHDGTNAQISAGTGNVSFPAAAGANFTGPVRSDTFRNGGGQDVLSFASASAWTCQTNSATFLVANGATNGVTFTTWTQPVNTSGSPTGLLFTGAAHTTLANANLVDVNWNLARTVQFTGGAGPVTITSAYGARYQAPVYQTAGAGALTITTAATLTVAGPPTTAAGGGGTTLTTAWAIQVETGNIGPLTTNVSNLGSGTFAWAGVYTRILQADAANNLLLNRNDGTVWATVGGAGVNTAIAVPTQWIDNVQVIFGSSGDASLKWATSSANNALYLTTAVNSAAQSGNIIVTTNANTSNEHGLAAVLTPRLSIFSAADMSVAGNRTQYIQMYHDGTDEILTGGSVAMNIMPRAAACQFRLDDTSGGTLAFQMIPRAQLSGSPVGFTFIGAAHTGLTIAEVIDINYNLARTVNFAAGGGTIATQRSYLIQAPTFSATTNAVTLTNAITARITATPTASTNITLTNPMALQVGGAVTIGATSAGLSYRCIDVPAHTVTVTGSTQVTAACGAAGIRLGQITVSDASAVTMDAAATLYIADAPVGGGAGPVTITNKYAIFVDAGISRFDGDGTIVFELPEDNTVQITALNTGRVPVKIAGNTRYLRYYID